jgi:hypothetical protein
VIGELFKLVLNPFVFSGLVLYIISTIVWLIALSKTTLSFVFPFTALIFVLVMLSIIALTYLLFVTPIDRKESLRPVFEVVSSQRTNGPIYLVGPSETTRGASFFYLGKRIPVLNTQNLLLSQFEDLPGTTLVIDSMCDDNRLLSHLRSKGYSPILQKKKYGKEAGICIYSNGS